jgi:hypothetical protein
LVPLIVPKSSNSYPYTPQETILSKRCALWIKSTAWWSFSCIILGQSQSQFKCLTHGGYMGASWPGMWERCSQDEPRKPQRGCKRSAPCKTTPAVRLVRTDISNKVLWPTSLFAVTINCSTLRYIAIMPVPALRHYETPCHRIYGQCQSQNRSMSSAQSDRLETRHKMLATTVVMTAQLHWCAVASASGLLALQ